jgi:hypothetical protein
VIFSLSEPASDDWLHAERLHGVIREHFPFEPLRPGRQCILRVGHVPRHTDIAARGREKGILGREVQAHRRVEPASLVRPIRRRGIQPHESLGFRIRKRPQQDCVYEAEHQGVGANAKCERNDDDESGARLPRHDARRIADVLQDLAQDRHGSHAAASSNRSVNSAAMSIGVPAHFRGISAFHALLCPLLGRTNAGSGRRVLRMYGEEDDRDEADGRSHPAARSTH